MDIKTAISNAERSLNTAQSSLKALQTSAKESNPVFQKALQELATNITATTEALKNVELIRSKQASPTSIQQSLVDSVVSTLQMMNAIEQDSTIKKHIAELNAPLIWNQILNFKATIASAEMNLKGVRLGQRIAQIDEMQP